MNVIITPRARKQIAAAHRWWLAHRDKAPEAFEDDIAGGIKMLAHAPLTGQPWPGRRGVRRLYLDRIRYYLFYRIVRDDVYVISVWHASRRPPRL